VSALVKKALKACVSSASHTISSRTNGQKFGEDAGNKNRVRVCVTVVRDRAKQQVTELSPMVEGKGQKQNAEF
jgi:hypothetical protein